MKNLLIALLVLLLSTAYTACTKTSFTTSKDAQLSTSADTLHFDTVFTSTGSVADRFKIFNPNKQKLLLSNIKLAGGATSAFKINVDGVAGNNFNNVELEAGDSLYVFVSVSINPNAANLPFIFRDSILINYNGNEKIVQLDAYGRNAHFLRDRKITADTSFTKDLPIVILGGLVVAPGVTLTLEEGTKIYVHADAPILINGSLHAEGRKFDSTQVSFQGDRLDVDFRDYPGSWPGIYFSETSRNNILTFTNIKNAFQGIITKESVSNPKITLNECTITNIYDAGILSEHSTIIARNCLVANCGNNIAIIGGGTYNFNHCTISSYSNLFINHKNPVLLISNANGQNQTNSLTANFRNCIFYGDSGIVKNEIVLDKKGTTPYSINFQNILYRNKEGSPQANIINSINNQDPQFDSLDAGKRIYNFRLKSTSPAINKGTNTGILFDLDGKPRGGTAGLPDIGAYEF
ncbi:MAG: hypothetical protein LH478_02550 [Chitinophagaceae bacterium]|nr:hypothetical protein [Chitinophagaceae bacterium]